MEICYIFNVSTILKCNTIFQKGNSLFLTCMRLFNKNTLKTHFFLRKCEFLNVDTTFLAHFRGEDVEKSIFECYFGEFWRKSCYSPTVC